jgi:hypothetical protein
MSEAVHRKQIARDRTPGWCDSNNVCALSDGDRHLGHVVLTARKWNAFDATHLDDKRKGFRYLGTFTSLNHAKAAVENSVASDGKETALAAAAGHSGLWVS